MSADILTSKPRLDRLYRERDSARAIDAINADILAAESRLTGLYRERGGRIISSEQISEDEMDVWAWCHCGMNRVHCSEGEDTCASCRSKL
jgi:hypothetical protein